MKTHGIYSAFTASFFLHFLIVIAAVVVVKFSPVIKAPTPYIVSLVDDKPAGARSGVEDKIKDILSPEIPPIAKEPAPATPEIPAPVFTEPRPVPPKIKETAAKKTDDVKRPAEPPQKPAVKKQAEPQAPVRQENRDIVSERIEALQAMRRIEQLAVLRRLVDIEGKRTQAATDRAGTPGHGTKTQAVSGEDYIAMVVNKIRQHWIFPETGDKDLLAIISIRIARDGRITVDKIEKSSGNPLFDRSALRAINSASPLPPPPQEIEIGVRFMP
jgi:TonB family protein